jgi:hypothetical protein
MPERATLTIGNFSVPLLAEAMAANRRDSPGTFDRVLRKFRDIEVRSLADTPNGALWTNKVLMHTGFIYPWSRLTDYSYEKQYLMHTKRIKSWTPLHLHIAY